MPSKGDAGRCRGVYVAHKSDTARDASRRERNFLIGKSCGVSHPDLKVYSSSKHALLTVLRRDGPEPGQSMSHAAAGVGPMASRASCFPRMGKSGRRRIGRGQRLTYAKSQDGTYLFQDGEGNADEDRRFEQQPMALLFGRRLRLPRSPLRIKAAGCFLVFRYNTGVPCLTLCPQSWGAHDNL